MNSPYGFRPKKGLGQHFLKDHGFIHEIITGAKLGSFDYVLEIGAGLGALTLPLSRRVRSVFAVEKDSLLAARLEKSLSLESVENVTIIHADALKLDFRHITGLTGERIKVIGNLPYNISSPFLEKLKRNKELVGKAVLMFQLEFARRLIATPGGKEYGAMTVLIQYHAHLSPLLEVPKEAFFPRPKVDAMVLEIDFGRPHPRRATSERCFETVVRGAFSHRRKTLLNSLKGGLPLLSAEEILAALLQCGIDPRKRAESLHIDDFLCLSSALPSLS